ncbi:MAG: endonuclease domain-containing protein [Anaerolineales bacterium]
MGTREESRIGIQNSTSASHLEICTDFYCAEAKLVIEIDGDSHAEPDQEAYDNARTAWLEDRGYKVIRITNNDVHKHLKDALKEIYITCQERTIK